MMLCEAFLPHTEEDDVALNATMLRLLNSPPEAPRKDHLISLGRIGGLDVGTTHWPPAFHTIFFFKADDEPIGFAILHEGGRNSGVGHTITIIYLQPPFRRQGFATAFYRFLLAHDVQLVPDTKQSAGGAAIWTKLKESEDPYAMTLYHGTDKVFDRFAPYSHFGTEAQARMRHPKRILTVTVKARKLKRLRDTGDWTVAELRRYERQGFDGVVYLNRYEGIPLEQLETAYVKVPADKLNQLSDTQFKKLIPAAEDSYIIFDPRNVRLT